MMNQTTSFDPSHVIPQPIRGNHQTRSLLRKPNLVYNFLPEIFIRDFTWRMCGTGTTMGSESKSPSDRDMANPPGQTRRGPRPTSHANAGPGPQFDSLLKSAFAARSLSARDVMILKCTRRLPPFNFCFVGFNFVTVSHFHYGVS